MAFPLIPVLLGGGVLALILFSGKKKEEPSGPIPGPQPGPQPIPQPRPVPPPLAGPKFRVDSTEAGFQGTNLYNRAVDNADAIMAVAKGSFVTVPNPNQRLPATAGAPEGWFVAEAPNGIQGYIKAEYLIGPVNVADAAIGRGGGHGGGGHGGGGFHGGGGRGGFRHGGGFVVNQGWGGGCGWPYYYGYPYVNPYLGYEVYASAPGYKTQQSRDAYAAWQQALKSGVDPAVVEHLKGQFESIIYAGGY